MVSVMFLTSAFLTPIASSVANAYTATTSTTVGTPVALSWQTVFNGYGTVNWSSDASRVTMSPKAATQPGETHAALVVSNQSLTQPYQVAYTMKTTKQLRTGSTPNPWEVGWGLFGYKSDGKFKYLTLKPNGLEMGESLLNLAQNFLYTSSTSFPINTSYNVDMTVANNVITIKVNGKQYLQYTMSSKDRLTADGKIGLYTEDATVTFSNIVAKQLSNGTITPAPTPVVSPTPTPIVSPTPTPTPTPVPAAIKVYGLTLDSTSNLSAVVNSLKSLPQKPWVRIVFDYPSQPSDYAAAVAAIAPYATIVGQPSDSTYNSKMTVDQYRARFQAYVSQLPQITIWETCNECNGDWLGANASAQADAATDVVKAAGKQALFTPYWNTNTCADANGPYVAWIQNKISTKVKTQSDYVMPSIYGFDCDGPEPNYSELDKMVSTFATMFPNAKVGIGEYGKQGSASIMSYYLNYNNANPRYIFAGLYWYGAQDLVPSTKPLWSTFSKAMQTVAPTPVIAPVAPSSSSVPLTFQTVFNGYGTVGWNSTGTILTMSPKAATQPGETHAALVISNQTLAQPYQVSYTMKTTKQLRTGSTPNAWEVAWGLFGYKSDGKFKYLTLKPNGLELGESLLNLAQNFLYTSSNPFPINTNYNVDMTVANNIVTIKVNGQQYLQYTMSTKDQLNADGKIGFYTEDATAVFSNIVAKQL